MAALFALADTPALTAFLWGWYNPRFKINPSIETIRRNTRSSFRRLAFMQSGSAMTYSEMESL